MECKFYKFKYYLNAKHSLDFEEQRIHSHTFTFTFYVEALNEKDFNKFMIVDDMLKYFFNQYSGQYLNEISPFDIRIPTIESMGDFFYEELKCLFIKHNYNLIKLEISETPVRVYAVSDRLFFGERIIGFES